MKIPAYQQLSKEQDAVYNLPLTGSHLIVGPPGTGKTVLAIHRADMLRRKGVVDLQLLVYSRPLKQYLSQATISLDVLAYTETFHTWFWKWYDENFNEPPPQVDQYVFDWLKIARAVAKKTDLKRYEHLIIDEGQDFPKEFYIVMQAIAENITVFADDNQRITNTSSTLKEISGTLRTGKMHKLTKNYRNSRPIAEFAKQFYANTSSGIPELPERNGPKARFLSTSSIVEQYDYIANYARNFSDRQIGIFVPTTDTQYTVLRNLEERQLHNVQLYISRDQNHKEVDFEQPGITVLSYQSAKGLEFDTVFLPNVEGRLVPSMTDIERMRFYVMTSRARQELILPLIGKQLPSLIKSFPVDIYEHREYRPMGKVSLK
jgi:superfamily I DNA/RNA helicase